MGRNRRVEYHLGGFKYFCCDGTSVEMKLFRKEHGGMFTIHKCVARTEGLFRLFTECQHYGLAAGATAVLTLTEAVMGTGECVDVYTECVLATPIVVPGGTYFFFEHRERFVEPTVENAIKVLEAMAIRSARDAEKKV